MCKHSQAVFSLSAHPLVSPSPPLPLGPQPLTLTPQDPAFPVLSTLRLAYWIKLYAGPHAWAAPSAFSHVLSAMKPWLWPSFCTLTMFVSDWGSKRSVSYCFIKRNELCLKYLFKDFSFTVPSKSYSAPWAKCFTCCFGGGQSGA